MKIVITMENNRIQNFGEFNKNSKPSEVRINENNKMALNVKIQF